MHCTEIYNSHNIHALHRDLQLSQHSCTAQRFTILTTFMHHRDLQLSQHSCTAQRFTILTTFMHFTEIYNTHNIHALHRDLQLSQHVCTALTLFCVIHPAHNHKRFRQVHVVRALGVEIGTKTRVIVHR